MAINIKRMLFRRCGGTRNFLLFAFLTLFVYLVLKHLYVNRSFGLDDDGSDETEDSFDSLNGGFKKAKGDDRSLMRNRTKYADSQECNVSPKCLGKSFSYKIVSGSGYDNYPLICFDGKLILSKDMKEHKIGRGINLVVIDKDTMEAKAVENFDTFSDDAALLRFLKEKTIDEDIVIMASYDEMSNGMRESSVKLLASFGSELIASVKFRDSFVFIGQRGIDKGKALEKVEHKGKKEFADAAILSGCASFPLSTITPIKTEKMHVNTKDQIGVWGFVKNCGMREECKPDEFAVHVYTGKNDKDEPKICVDGKYVIAKGVNDAGRGLNIVVVGNGKEVLKTAHFDTYQEDSTNLEIFLENIGENNVIIAVTFDEASTKLGTLARSLLYDLGSGLIQNLRFRDSWYFVGRSGINGFTPIEEISYSGTDGAFPKLLDKKICVPQTLKGQKIRPDSLPVMNDRRRDFCSRFDGYGDFCAHDNIDKPLLPAPIINKTLEDHPVYTTPILVVAAMSHNSLRMTLETLIMQPGIRPELVFVFVDEKMDELIHLIDLFDFKFERVESSTSYTDIFHKALTKLLNTNLIDKSKKEIIVIEEELILSPDFLYYFTQIYDTFVADPTLVAASTWNPNSYLQVDGSASVIYRTNDFPGFGFMLKRDYYDKHMRSSLNECCSQRAWYNWRHVADKTTKTTTSSLQDDANTVDVLVPDVSRVYRRSYDISSSDFTFLSDLFNRKRKTNLLPFTELIDLKALVHKQAYSEYLQEKIGLATTFPNIEECYSNGSVTLPDTSNVIYRVVYEQSTADDLSNLIKLSKCFGLFHSTNQPPKGLYLGSLLRFHSHNNDYILIGKLNTLLKVQS